MVWIPINIVEPPEGELDAVEKARQIGNGLRAYGYPNAFNVGNTVVVFGVPDGTAMGMQPGITARPTSSSRRARRPGPPASSAASIRSTCASSRPSSRPAL